MMYCRIVVLVSALAGVITAVASADLTGPTSAPAARPELVKPVVEGRWLRPPATTDAVAPIWGHADGLRIGLAPPRGPRGLLPVYAPYLGQRDSRMINFVAIEPIPEGADGRGYSELERSGFDGRAGKCFWISDGPDDGPSPRPPERPRRGVIETIDEVEQLTQYVQIEPFDNGASVYLRVRFRADRPHEVGIAVFARPDSKPLKQCVVTATMGNYARLRNLQLLDRSVNSKSVWPAYRGDGFTPHATFPLSELKRTPSGDAYASATPDEANPTLAEYAAGTGGGWKYEGRTARQFWRMPSPPTGLCASVNGRFTYWASQSPIPGGVSFENFELTAPFEQGQEFWFGVEPLDAGERRTTMEAEQQR
jgi:hypothetical protein